MAPLLVEPDLLRDRQPIAIRPVSRQLVDSDDQVDQSVAIPVVRDNLNDSARTNSQVPRQSQRSPRSKRRPSGIARVREPNEALRLEPNQVKPARRTVGDRAKTAQAV